MNRRGAQLDYQRVLDSQLRHIIRSVPYNSFAPVLAASGIATPTGLGGNCIYQARVLAERLRAQVGGKVQFLVDGRHHAVLVSDREHGIYYVDPYLGHLRAIRVPEQDGSVTVTAYPAIRGRLGRLHFSQCGEHITVSKHVPNARTK